MKPLYSRIVGRGGTDTVRVTRHGVMPRVSRTILPRIRKSIRERGLMVTLARSVLLPLHLIREYRSARLLRRERPVSEFDIAHDVETEGDFQGWTYLSDLEIKSSNWIHGSNYAAIEPERFHATMAALPISFEDFTFVDFGSGKGRALLLASEYPFKRIIGLEFSRELHDAACANVSRYRSATQKCRAIEPKLADFVGYALPSEPTVLFFFEPCDATLLQQVMTNLQGSLRKTPCAAFVAYVGPRSLELERLATFLHAIAKDTSRQFAVYRVVLM